LLTPDKGGILSSNEEAAVNMLYDSDDYVVVYYPIEIVVGGRRKTRTRDGFEIVDKDAGKSVYLDGPWAEAFQRQISAWQVKTPLQEEVDEVLEGLCELAQIPLVMH
jgi:hypothetical protein